MAQGKRYPYLVSTAAAGTSHPEAQSSALPNNDVIDDARLVNRTKHPMRVSKYQHTDRLNVVGATNQKGRDVSVVERGWAGDSKSRDGWQVGHASNFTAQIINVSDHNVASLTHSNSSTCKPCTWWCGWLNEVDSER